MVLLQGKCAKSGAYSLSKYGSDGSDGTVMLHCAGILASTE